jgi:hypothetical protein
VGGSAIGGMRQESFRLPNYFLSSNSFSSTFLFSMLLPLLLLTIAAASIPLPFLFLKLINSYDYCSRSRCRQTCGPRMAMVAAIDGPPRPPAIQSRKTCITQAYASFDDACNRSGFSSTIAFATT